MSAEFKIKSSVDLSTDEAKQKLNDLKDFEKKPIEIKVKISNTLGELSKLETALKSIGKLSTNTSTNPFKSVTTGAEKTQTEILAMAKVISNTINGLNKQLTSGKLTVDGVSDVKGQIEDLNKALDNYKGIMNDATRVKFDLFQESNSIKSIKEMSSNLNKIESSAEAVSKAINGINFDGLSDTNKISSLKNELNEISDKAKQGLILDIDIGTTLNRIQDIKEEIKQLEQVSDISLKIDSSGLPLDEIERLKTSVKELEDNASNLDGSFKSSFNGVSSQLNSSMSAMQKMNKETSALHKQWGDFKSSFAAYSLGNVAGDFIIDGIRGLKNTFLELDTGMANIKKLANEIDVNTTGKLNNIKNDAISIAKDVGQSSTDVMEAISTTLQMGVGGMQESIEVAKSASILANVGEISADVSAKSMASIINAWKLNPLKEVQVEMNGTVKKSNELTSALDMLNFASNNYSIGVEGLTSAISAGGSTLSAYGVSLGDTIGLMTAANNSIQDPSRVGNGLKTISVALQGIKTSADTGELSLNKTAKGLREIGKIDIYSDKKTGQIKNMTQILDELASKWSNFNDEQRAGLSEAIAGKQQSAVFQSLMQNYDTFKKIQSEFANNEQFGSAIKENEAYVNSLSGKINEFKEIWKDTASSLVTNDFLKDSMDGVNAFSEGIGTLVKSLGNLSGTIKPIMAGFATFGTMKLGSKLFDTAKDISAMSSLIEEGSKISDVLTLSNSKFTQNISKSFGVMKKSMAEGNGLLSSLGAGFTSLGKIGTAAFAGLAVGGVGMLISYLDNLKEKERQAYEERKENIASMQESTKQMQSQRDGLADIVVEYDKLSNKTKLSEKELERFNQLKQKIADTNPELTDGIDADGNPIIKLNGSLQEYITNLDKAIAKQQSLTYADLKENSKQAMKTLNKYDTVASDSNSETLLAHQLSYNRKIEDLRRKEQQSYQKYLTSQGKDREKALADLRAYQNEEQEVYAEYSKNFDIVKNDIEQAASQLSQRMVEGLKSNKAFTGLSEDLQSQFLEFSNSLDFSEITSEDMFADAQVSLQNLLKLAQSGKLDFKDLQKSISDATKEFNQTGDMDAYIKNIDEILNSVDGLNQLDKDVLRNMFVGVPESLHETSSALDTVLEKFGKTKLDVQNGDILANDLKKQFESVTALADLEVSSDAKVNLNIVTDIINNNELPTELRNLVNQMINDGVASDKIIEVVKQIALDYQLDGKLDQEGLQKFIDSQVGEGKYTITPEMVVDPKIESKAKEKLEQELKGYDKISGRKEIKTLFTTDVVGLEKAQLFEETIEKLPVNKEFTNKFLCDFATDISELESYEEVLALIDSLPDDVKKKYGFEVETNAEEEKEKLDRIESMQFTDKQQRIIADTTDAEYKLQLFQSMTPEEMSMILNLNSIPAEEKLAFFNSLSPEQKVAILTCNPNPGIGILDLWDSLSAEDKQSLIKADPSGALAQLSRYNNTPIEHKESKITGNNSDAIKKSTATKQSIISIPGTHNTDVTATDGATRTLGGIQSALFGIPQSYNINVTTTKTVKTRFVGGGGGHAAEGKSISTYSISPFLAEQPNKIALLSDNTPSETIENPTIARYASSGVSSITEGNGLVSSYTLNSIEQQTKSLDKQARTFENLNNQVEMFNILISSAFGEERNRLIEERNQLIASQNEEINSVDFKNANIDDYINQLDNLHESFNIDELIKTANMTSDYLKNMPDIRELLQVNSNMYVPNNNIQNTSSVQINSPLIVIEGNADANTVSALEGISDKLVKEIIAKIESRNNKTKRLEGRI